MFMSLSLQPNTFLSPLSLSLLTVTKQYLNVFDNIVHNVFI